MSKKVSYVQLLKEHISEFDTKVLDAKGPMIEPIIGWEGEGDIKTTHDAASVLERYYFDNDEKEVELFEEGPIDNPVDEEPDDSIASTKRKIEKAVTEEDDAVTEDETVTEEKEPDTEEAGKSKAGPKIEGEEVSEEFDFDFDLDSLLEQEDEEEGEEEEKEEEEEEEVKESATIDEVENSVIEKLIGELEEQDEKEDEKEEEKGEKELDIDKETGEEEEKEEEKEEVKEGPIGPLAYDEEDVEEMFRAFKEQIETEDEDLDSEDILV